MSGHTTNHLPAGWVEAHLGDVCELGAGGPAPQEEEHFSRDGRPFVRVQDLGRLGYRVWIHDTADRLSEEGVRASRLKPIPAGSVLFTKSGMSTLLNQRAILASDAFVVSHIGYAIPEPGILSQWLYWALKRIDFGPLAHATTLPSLKLSKVQEIKIPVAPTPEQRRIVAEIEKQFTRLEAAVAALKRVQANLKRYRAAVLKAVVEGRLVPTEAELARREGRAYETADELLQRILAERRARWEADQLAKFRTSGSEPKDDSWKQKYREPDGVDDRNLPRLPQGWTWAATDQVGDVRLGRQRSPKHHVGPYMRPYLRVANVFEDRIDTSDVLEMNFTPAEFEVYQLKFGDVLLNEGQSLELVGRPAIYRDEVPGACFQNTLIRFRSASGINPDYALTVFLSYLHNKRFQKAARWTVNIAHLGADRLSRIEFPVPPANEQTRIVAEVERRLSVIQELQIQVEGNLKRADRLRQAILRRAFEGKLVPQDPSDEPASALVERIRVERTQAEATIWERRTNNRRRAKDDLAHAR